MYGLLGEKLGHSYSKLIHGMLAEYQYEMFPTERDKLKDFMHSGCFQGLNVTIPYKKSVISYCKTLSDEAKKIGSVNTVIADKKGELHGYNTDYYGFLYMANAIGVSFSGKKVLVLGSGGTSLTACAAVRDSKGDAIVISRSGKDSYDNIQKHADADIIVNTTPVGMFPSNGQQPVDLSEFPDCSAVLDVIYNPHLTRLLMQAQELGIPYAGGLRMLVAQAKRACELFEDRHIDDSVIEEIKTKIEKTALNIVLIGMPGCGKSSVGAAAAHRLGRDFCDIDTLITEKIGMDIPRFFEEHGETEFRKIEAEVAAECGKNSGLVISTGGGIVKSPMNYVSLRQNGIIVYLKREVERLDTDRRPLSSDAAALKKLCEERIPLYNKYADITVDNNCDFESAVSAVCGVVL